MQTIHYVMLAQGAVSLFVAFYLTRKLRGFIRATIVRLMPVKHRISDESFNLQTRLSTLTTFVIGLSLSGLFYWGIDELVASMRPVSESRQQIVDLPERPVEPERPLVIAPGPEPINPPEPAPQQTIDEPPKEKSLPVNEYDTAVPPPASVPTGEHYIQLYAFASADRALAQQLRHEQLLNRPVRIIPRPGTIGPYKVVVGPFPSRTSANEFKQRMGLKGTVLGKGRLMW